MSLVNTTTHNRRGYYELHHSPTRPYFSKARSGVPHPRTEPLLTAAWVVAAASEDEPSSEWLRVALLARASTGASEPLPVLLCVAAWVGAPAGVAEQSPVRLPVGAVVGVLVGAADPLPVLLCVATWSWRRRARTTRRRSGCVSPFLWGCPRGLPSLCPCG